MNDNTGRKQSVWVSLACLAICYAAIFNPVYVRYFLYDAMREAMQITNTQLSMLQFGSIFLQLFTSIPSGWLADKVSPKKLLLSGLFWRCPIVILMLLWLDVYWIQFILYMIMSISMIGFVPAILRCVRIIGGQGKQSAIFGFFESGHGTIAMLGNFLALYIFSRFTDPVLGYKAAFLSMGIVCWLAAILVFFCFEDIPIEEREIEHPTGEKAYKPSVWQTLWMIVKDPNIWLISLVIFSVYGIYSNSSYFTPYFTGVLGAAVTITGAFSIIRDYGAKIFGGLLGGQLAQKLGSTSLLNCICLLTDAVLILIVSRMTPDTPHVLLISMVFVLANSYIMCMAKATYWANLGEAGIPIEYTGIATVVISLFGFSGADVFFPLTAGRLLDSHPDNLAYAYHVYFTVMIIACLLGAIAAYTIHRRNKRRKEILELFGE